MDGVINILKPPGMSSHDVVKHIRYLTKVKKVGHTGTLDPGAGGVLPICLGGATKLSDLLVASDKQYIAEMTFGVETDSLDSLGQVVSWDSPPNLDNHKINDMFNQFLGEIEQIPPMVSALKVKGQKLYELARKGEIIERQPRKVVINRLSLLSYGVRLDRLTGTQLPYIRFIVDCSKGTYVRSLCADMGRYLESSAHMSFLVRTKVGQFEIGNTHTLEMVRMAKENNNLERIIIPVDIAFSHLPSLVVNDDAISIVRSGNWLFPPDVEGFIDNELRLDLKVRLYNRIGQFIGIYKYELSLDDLAKQPRVRKFGYKSALRPVKVFI